MGLTDPAGRRERQAMTATGAERQNRFNFTKEALERVRPTEAGRDTYRDATERRLYLFVTAAGGKSFYYVRRLGGRTYQVRLGAFPEMTIHQARQACAKQSGRVAEGGKPGDDRERRNAATFGELFAKYQEEHARPHCRTWAENDRKLRVYFPDLATRPLDAIDTEAMARLHRRIGEARGHYLANRCLTLIRSVYSHAARKGVPIGNPCVGVQAFKEQSRERFLDAEELTRFFAALESEPNGEMRDFFTLALLTGARRGNLQSLRWDELSFSRQTWTIPPEKFKNGQRQTVVLTGPALEILERRKGANETRRAGPSDYVFPCHRRAGVSLHMTEPRRAWLELCKRAKLVDLRIHDLRRTLGSWQAAGGASLPIIGKSLGHKSQQATAIYARLNLDPVRASVEAATAAMLKTAEPKEAAQ
jgi:integrase